jgi:hypothetical protein
MHTVSYQRSGTAVLAHQSLVLGQKNCNSCIDLADRQGNQHVADTRNEVREQDQQRVCVDVGSRRLIGRAPTTFKINMSLQTAKGQFEQGHASGHVLPSLGYAPCVTGAVLRAAQHEIIYLRLAVSHDLTSRNGRLQRKWMWSSLKFPQCSPR